ncbi:MAG: TonB-dependent receptor [Bacteroidales bacterium]|nr:TonB-dependent receptor [Bacteroidales bacterium]
MARILMVFILTGFLLQNAGAQEYLLSGKVIDGESGEWLIGAAIQVTGTSKGAVTDENGTYILKLPRGIYNIQISYIGYERLGKEISLTADRIENFTLIPKVIESEEVIITTEKPEDHFRSTETGLIELKAKDIKALPTLMGEADALRILQLSPGVSSVTEGNAGFYVRGGGADQNLILIDNATVYSSSHVLGFFSVFNSDAIHGVRLTKSGMPAFYGGRLASVMDVEMLDGNPDSLETTIGIGLISSKIAFQGPILKNRITFSAAVRRSYLDEVVKPVISPFLKNQSSFFKDNKYHFYDINGKLAVRLSGRDRVTFTLYNGIDKYSLQQYRFDYENYIKWGNTLGVLNYNHIFNKDFAVNTSLSFTEYFFNFSAVQSNIQIGLSSLIRDVAFKIQFTKLGTNNGYTKFGIDYQKHRFLPNNLDATANDLDLEFGSNRVLNAHETAIYYDRIIPVGGRLSTNIGLRYTNFLHVGPYQKMLTNNLGEIYDTLSYGSNKVIKPYNHIEPRISARYLLNDNSSLKASFTQNYQYIHLASASAVTLPTDVWLPSTEKIKPQQGEQYTLGYFVNSRDNIYQASVDMYYKTLKNQVELLYGIINNFKDNIFEESVIFGSGSSYGIEFYIRKTQGKMNGWIGYTLSKTTRKFDEINEGKIYPAKYDRRHDVNLVVSYVLNKKWTFSGTFIYASGNAMTLPEYKYLIDGNVITGYGPTNGFRMPDYHRLDLSATYSGKKAKRYESSWNFSVINLYNRANPYFIYFEISGDVYDYNLKITPHQVSLYPILPSVTWSIKF